MSDDNNIKRSFTLKKITLEKKKLDPSFASLEKTLQDKLAQEKKLLGQDLELDERQILDCFEKNRMILERIHIIYNQAKKSMGKPLLTQKEIRLLLESLSFKGYLTVEPFKYENKDMEAFILTEKGQQLRE
jgi:hypothetical protein